MIKKLLILIAVAALAGCASNRYIDRGYQVAQVPSFRPLVYVEDPELKKEFGVLDQSKLFQISSDPSVATHLTLTKMQFRPEWNSAECGMGLMGPVFTLGIIPGEVFTPGHHFA